MKRFFHSGKAIPEWVFAVLTTPARVSKNFLIEIRQPRFAHLKKIGLSAEFFAETTADADLSIIPAFFPNIGKTVRENSSLSLR